MKLHLSVLCSLALPGCLKMSEPQPAAQSKEVPAVAAVVGPTPVPTSALSLTERMARESASRPTGTPTAEAILELIKKDGFTLKTLGQHLASPVGAIYCVGATLEEDVSLSICEYADEAAAKKGRELSASAFSAIKGREVFLNKKTTLALLQSPPGERASATARKLSKDFTRD
ncbi:MAG: hypothetical protein ACT4TC_01330 [Myxococcaceae bacterium]